MLPLFSLSGLQGQSTEDLQSTIRQRTGNQVEWQKDVEARDQIREAIRVLLRRTLTADSAVQIALLNIRELQATFEEIGIAQADLIEAGLLKNPIFAGDARFPNRSPSGTDIEMSIAQEFFDLLVIPLRKKVAAAHPKAQAFFYPAGHGFNCDQRGSYHAESAKLARTRSLEFLRKHIG